MHFKDEVRRSIGGYAICVDASFPIEEDLQDKLIAPISEADMALIPEDRRAATLARQASIDLHRQPAVWGMRALKGTFARVKARLSCDKEKRLDILLSIVLLHNFRMHRIGLNQIKTAFDSEYEQYLNLEGYDRVARYFQLKL